MRRTVLLLPLAAVVASCSVFHGERSASPSHFGTPAHRVLTLGIVASGDTRSPDGQASGACAEGGRAGQAQDHLYRFDAMRSASYRFELETTFRGTLSVYAPSSDGDLSLLCLAAEPGKRARGSLPLEMGSYKVVVDGTLWDQAGTYQLRVTRDTSPGAVLGPEDPTKVDALCKSAPALTIGASQSGIATGSPGGARASCGLVGTDTVVRVDVPRRMKVKLHGVAHMDLALELRRTCVGEVVACATGGAGDPNHVELVAELDKGSYWLVVDAAHLAPRDRYGWHGLGSGIEAAFALNAEEVR